MDAAIAIASAESRFRERRYAEALDLLDAAVGAGARDAALHSNRCLVLQRLGRTGDAVAAGRQAVALQPAMPAAHANLAGALRMANRFDEALAALDAALRIDASFADAHAQRGLVLQQLGQPKDAI